MEHKTFTVRLPARLVEALDAEAFAQYLKRNARNQLLLEILRERYREQIAKAKRRGKSNDQTPILESP